MKSKRYNTLDVIRGFALVNMIIYHALWDVVYIFDVNIKWYRTLPGHIWQQFICHTFIILSGFCFSLGSKKLKRGLTVLGASAVISIVTLLFMPESRILFGVLSLIGSSMLILIPLQKVLKKVNPYMGFLVFFIIFILTKPLPDQCWSFGNVVSAYFGFRGSSFWSVDYFPLIPWLFLYISGWFLYEIFARNNLLKYLNSIRIKPLEWIGRHSLLIYMLHQPLIYCILTCVIQM